MTSTASAVWHDAGLDLAPPVGRFGRATHGTRAAGDSHRPSQTQRRAAASSWARVHLELYVAVRSSSRAETAPQQHVLMTLAGYADDKTGACWPSIATLARDTKLSTSTVRAALRALEALGHVVRET